MEERDFFQTPLTEDELKSLLGNTSPSDVFSWKSPRFRGMGLSSKLLRGDDLIRLMLREPRLIRRPLITVDDRLIVGADWQVLEAVFP